MSSAISVFRLQVDLLMSKFQSIVLDNMEVFKITLLLNFKRSKFTYLGAAIALYAVTKMYQAFAFPRRLGHIKRIPLLPMFKSLIAGETQLERNNKFLFPNWKETNGVAAMYGQHGWAVVVTNPDAVRTILYKTDIFPKFETIEFQKQRMLFTKFFGRNNLAGANGHEWKRRRKIVYPAFRRSMPAKTFAVLTSRMFEQIDKTEGSVDIQGLLQRFTLDAIGRIGFGFEFNATNSPNGEWVLTYNDVADNIGDFRFLFFPNLDSTFLGLFPERQKKHQSLDRLNKLFDEIIEHKRAELAKGVSSAVEENEKDLLTLMIEAGGEDDTVEPLSAQELRDEVALFFLAGHDTTSSAMTAVLYFLAANQDIQAKARKEVLDILGDEKFDVWPTLQQLKEFTYLTKIMKEAIRLAPPAAGLVDRLATEDTELAGTHIPKGTIIKIDVVGLHYNSNLWKDPTKFDPDRFDEGGELESMPSTYAYLPFGGGSRQCIGMNFSLAEQRVALSSIIRKYELSLPDDSIHKDGIVFGTHLLIFTVKDMKINFTRRY